MKKVTMDEIAAELNISKSLVSRALSNKYGVNSITRERVFQKAMALNYDFKKPTIKPRNSISVSVIICNLELLVEAFWSEILLGIKMRLNDMKVTMNTVVMPDDCVLSSLLIILEQYNTDGIIIVSTTSNSNILAGLKQRGLPIVLIDNQKPTSEEFDHISANNYMGGYNAAKYLIEKGHKQIAFCGDPNYAQSFSQRMFGFKSFIDHCGLDLQFENLIAENDNHNGIYNHAQILDYLLRHSKDCIAIMCANDKIAFFIYEICRDLGLGYDIGKRISIMGFDNTKTCHQVSPKLTSVNVQKKHIGYKAAEKIVARIKLDNTPPETIEIATYIDEKESVFEIATKS